MGRGSITGSKDAPEVKPSAELKSTLPEALQSPPAPKPRRAERPPAEDKGTWFDRLLRFRSRRHAGSSAPS